MLITPLRLPVGRPLGRLGMAVCYADLASISNCGVDLQRSWPFYLVLILPDYCSIWRWNIISHHLSSFRLLTLSLVASQPFASTTAWTPLVVEDPMPKLATPQPDRCGWNWAISSLGTHGNCFYHSLIVLVLRPCHLFIYLL